MWKRFFGGKKQRQQKQRQQAGTAPQGERSNLNSEVDASADRSSFEPRPFGNGEAHVNSLETIMTDHQVQQPKADIGKQQIGTVYAKAFLAAAAQSQSVDQDLDEFGALVATVLNQQPTFEATLSSPRVAVEEKIGLLDRTLKGNVSEGLLKFLKVVCRHERLDCLREIYLAARDQHHQAKGVVQVHVTTAEALDGGMSERVKSELGQHLKSEVDLVQKVDPSIVGGMIIRIGDMVYDSSVRQKLASIRQKTVDNTSQQMRESLEKFAPSN